jgi:cytochrome c peroxidase
MKPWICLRVVLVVLSTAAAALTAQHRRFVLPEQPHDYSFRHAAGLESHFSLRMRNEVLLPAEQRQLRDHRATLGRVLFYDPQLSHNEAISCASCHQQAHAFASARRRDRGISGKPLPRNSMSLMDLVTLRVDPGSGKTNMFWDGQRHTLETAVLQPIQHPKEMGLALPELVDRLAADRDYRGLFAAAFGDEGVDAERVGVALAAFVGAMRSYRSRYDEGLGMVKRHTEDFPNFTELENHGKKLFYGRVPDQRVSCFQCHTGAAERLSGCGSCGVNSYTPDPLVFGSHQCFDRKVGEAAAGGDPGHAGVTGNGLHRGMFRAPSLRNVAVTGPYLHDGSVATLARIVRGYAEQSQRVDEKWLARGGLLAGQAASIAPSLGEIGALPTFAGSRGRALDSRDEKALVAFLETLTDRAFLQDERFGDPFRR